MLFKDYEARGLLFNTNLTERCTTEALDVYRGELILVEGEVSDSSGRRAPPACVLQQAVAMADDKQLRFLSGSLVEVARVATVLEKYGQELFVGSLVILFVFDLAKPLTVSTPQCTVHLLPLEEGLTWNELVDLAALEKGDLKSLSSADKVLAVYRELIGFRPRGTSDVTLPQALAASTGRQRVLRGPV